MTSTSLAWRRAGLLVMAVLLAGCAPANEPEVTATPADPGKQRVIRFWDRFREASRVRSGGDCQAAVTLYEEALELDPKHEDSLYYLGQCRRELGEPLRAREAFDRLVELNPGSARGHLALGALLASPDPAEPMDLETAERHLSRAHEINAEETGPVIRLGEVTLARGRFAEARSWFEAALQTNAKSVEAALLAGYVAWEKGDDPSPLARRVRDAAAVEAPTKGVLNEGDRRDAKGRVARPLSHPLGRLLFGAPIDSLRARASAGEAVTDDHVLDAWREVATLCREYQARP